MSIPYNEQSAHSDTLTSPNKRSVINSKHHNLQIQFMQLKEQSRRELEACYQEIELLKEQLYRKNEQIQNLEDNVIMKLRQELNLCRRDNIKYCQSEQRVKKQYQKTKTDQHNLTLQNQRLKKQRKIYHEKLEHVKTMYDDIKKQLDTKDKNFQKYYCKALQLQKQLQNMRYESDDFRTELRQKDKQVYESETEYKNLLQRNFIMQSQLKTLQIKHRDQQLIMSTYKERSKQLEKEREELLDRLDELQRNQTVDQLSYTDQDKHSLVQIQSLIKQVHHLLESKSQHKDSTLKLSSRFKASLACLSKTIHK